MLCNPQDLDNDIDYTTAIAEIKEISKWVNKISIESKGLLGNQRSRQQETNAQDPLVQLASADKKKKANGNKKKTVKGA